MSNESSINVNLVFGGFILTTPDGVQGYRTEVFTSEGKLMKAIRTAVQANSLVSKPTKAEADDDKEAE